MNRHFFSAIIATLFCAAGCFASVDSIPEATPETFVGGKENLQLVKAATAITAFRIVDSQQTPRPAKLVTIDGHQCDASSSNVTGSEVTQVVGALADMSNFGGGFMCDFDPGVILRFSAAERTLDLVICFRCGEMVLYADGKIVRRPYKWASTKNSFHKEAVRAFTAVAKKAFPNDAQNRSPEIMRPRFLLVAKACPALVEWVRLWQREAQ